MKKVRITKAPQYSEGGPNKGDQIGYSLYTGGFASDSGTEGVSIRSLFPEASESEATIEAEKGETILHDADGDGKKEHFNIGGKRHEQGGTPIAAEQGDFVFSDRKKLAIKGPILEEFGKSPENKKGFTPAQLAKQYNINFYKGLLNDPEADPIQKKTAETMIQNYEQKLAELAMVQEGMKGFPNGIPEIAMAMFEGTGQEQAPAGAEPEMATGGLVQFFGGGDPLEEAKKRAKKVNSSFGITDQHQFVGRDGSRNYWSSGTAGSYSGGHNVAGGARSNFTVDDILNNKNRYKTFHDNMAGAPDDVLRQAAQNLLQKGVMPGKWTPGSTDYIYTESEPVQFERTITPHDIRLPTPKPITNTNEVPPAETTKTTTTQTTTPQDTPMKWWTQDKLNTMSAFMNRYNIRKQLPWEPVANAVLPDPTFVDPTRALAANAEQAAIQSQAGAMFAGAQRQRAVNSSIQGQAAGQAANIISQYDNQNVGIANQFAGARAEIQNNVNLQNLASKKRLYDGNVLANENFDKEKKMANEVVRKQFINGMTNAQKTHWMNEMFDQFDIDPTTGAILFNNPNSFKFGRNAGGGSSSSAATSYVDAYMALKEKYPNASEEVLRKQAEINAGGARRTQQDDNGDGVMDKAKLMQSIFGAMPMFGG